MSSQIEELISKIKSDGIDSAEAQAKQIEEQARAKAQQIIKEAEDKAESILNQAQIDADKLQESAKKSLEQASRDTLLSLRKEIQGMLSRLVSHDVSSSLNTDQLAEIIGQLIKDSSQSQDGIQIELNKKDHKQLADGFIEKLQNQVKHGIEFQTSDDVTGGFAISFDGGKSSFDFTDESLAQYMTTFLNEQVAGILKKAV